MKIYAHLSQLIKLLKEESASSQTRQDDINLTEVPNEEEKSYDSLDSTGNCSEPRTQTNDHQDINTAFYKWLRLESKFVGKNVSNLQEETYLHLKFACYPKVSNLCLQLIG